MKMFAMVLDDGWSISKATLETKLRERWPGIEITDEDTGDAHILKWQGPEIYEGWLSTSGEAIVMEGDVEPCSRAAVWFRELVPPHYRVAFFDEGYNASVDVLPTMTADDLAAQYLAEVNA